MYNYKHICMHIYAYKRMFKGCSVVSTGALRHHPLRETSAAGLGCCTYTNVRFTLYMVDLCCSGTCMECASGTGAVTQCRNPKPCSTCSMYIQLRKFEFFCWTSLGNFVNESACASACFCVSASGLQEPPCKQESSTVLQV